MYACYDWIDNTIMFGNRMKNISEDGAIYILIHEIEHFAQNMYLDAEETNHSVDGFNRNYECPFVEYITAHPGKYDFSRWDISS